MAVDVRDEVRRTSERETVRLTTAQAIVRFLSVQFSERDGASRRLIPATFGIFGHGNVAGLGQALFEHGREMPYYQPCNEQSMVHTASGFAKATLRLATLACTSSIGPGATNMVTGAATATINHLPVLLLPADYYATRHQGPVLQQIEHPVSADASVNDCFRPISRFFDRISRPEQLLTALPEAMRVLTDPVETGAVTLALPQDVQAHAYDFPLHFFAKRTWRIERRPPDARRVDEAVALLKGARRPLIIAGGGIHYAQAWDELQDFSERFGIPVGETFVGRGSIQRESDLLLGGLGVTGTPAAGKIAAQADLVICVGTRLTDFTTGSQSAFQHPDVRFIGINVSGHDAYKNGALPIVSDAREALRALIAGAATAEIKPSPAYLAEIREARDTWHTQVREEIFRPVPGEAMSQGQIIGILNEEARPGDAMVAAAGGPPGDLHKLWDATGDRPLHVEFGFSCMGWEIPAGLGMRLARKEGEVVVFVGDGTFLMNPTEIVTAAQEDMKVTIIIAENHGYQVIRQLQINRVGHSFGNEFRARDAATNRLEGQYIALDLPKIAEGMGARAWRAETPDQLRTALREARTERKPCVIVVETEKHRYLPGSGIWWDVAPAEATHDPVTGQRRADYVRERANFQRFYYGTEPAVEKSGDSNRR